MPANDDTAPKPRYTLRPVMTPLPSARDADADSADEAAKPFGPRAENEDDDGYDPFSDYHDGTARVLEFEEDPWR